MRERRGVSEEGLLEGVPVALRRREDICVDKAVGGKCVSVRECVVICFGMF